MPIDKTLSKIISQYNNGTYLETGFFLGESALIALKLGFKKVISIEYNEEFVNKGKFRFQEYIKNKKLEIIKEDSGKIIETILVNNPDITVIFLDALHYVEDEDISAPLEKELAIIKKFNERNFFLIIDDFYQIKNNFKLKENNWRKKHNYKKIIKIVNDIFGSSSEIYYRYGKKYNGNINSYLISKKVNILWLVYNKINNLFLSFIITQYVKSKILMVPIIKKLLGIN